MKLIQTIRAAWQRWSDKQQNIYETYQAAAPARREAWLKANGRA